jgi:hypothetical protein
MADGELQREDCPALKILGEKAKYFVTPAANIALSMPIAAKGMPGKCRVLLVAGRMQEGLK